MKMNPKLSKAVGWTPPEILHWPALEDVKKANDAQILHWYRFLPSPENEEQTRIMNRIYDKFHNKGKADSFAEGHYK